MIKRENGYALAPQNFWRFIALMLVAHLILAVFIFEGGTAITTETYQLWTRYTARLSFPFFFFAFIAGPLYELSQSRAALFIRRNRRNFGVSFAVSHLIHLVAIILYFINLQTIPDMVTLILGGGAYLAMLAMLFTSTDAALRKLGKVKWGRLHKFGIYYLAIGFTNSYTGRFFDNPSLFEIILAATIWLGWTVRLAAFIKTRTG